LSRPRGSFPLPDRKLTALVRAALAEDIGTGDVTSRLTIPAGTKAAAVLVARSAGTLCGVTVCERTFRALDPKVRFTPRLKDGARFKPGDELARVVGPARSLLAAERTALNFIQRLSGIATHTARFVAAVKGTNCRILDTRKTLPGWRMLEKYAVRCGGGTNHRLGLYDMVLVKDNHIAAAGSITAALARCRTRLPVEVECRTPADVREALVAAAKRILLDNMSMGQLRQSVALTRGRAKLEASGGITLANVGRVARTGVDFISVGAITHSAPAADIALDFLPG
jgi:nicotinate-nucleotide pyrophosphorylase (carboxylating)